ncbi:MAG: hypothetical protein GXP49_04575, partial [Deltaproteobacteria bacterium]|nr:hypothetical protein [Deltaproteobacteria bacterium]
DLNLQRVKVQGEVKLLGNQLPSQKNNRGYVMFKNLQGGAMTDLGYNGPGDYSILLTPGTYDVSWQPNTAGCQSNDNELPCNPVLLKKDVKLTQSGILDLNLQRVKVQGEVKLLGNQLPSQKNNRGYVAGP